MAHICIFHHDHPIADAVEVGGAERVVFRFAEFCAQRNHSVSVITKGVEGDVLKNGVRFCFLGREFDLARGREILASLQPDHLISISRGDVLEACIDVIPACTRWVWFHESRIDRTFSNASQLNMHADGFIFISRAQMLYYQSQGLDLDKGKVVYNGYNRSVFYPKDCIRASNRICYAGALVPEKGIDMLINAFLIVRHAHPEAELHLFGSEAMWARVPQYTNCVQSLKLTGISVHGTVSQERLANEFSKATVAVFPTLSSVIEEGLGMASIEAQACGCPVIVTNSGGLPETVSNGESGLILSDESSVGLAELISQIFSDQDLRVRLQSAALHVRDHFDPIHRQDQLLAHLTARHASASPVTLGVSVRAENIFRILKSSLHKVFSARI